MRDMSRRSQRGKVFVVAITVVVAIGCWAQSPTSQSPQSIPPGKEHKATLNWSHSPNAKQPGVKLKYIIRRADAVQVYGKTECGKDFAKIAEVDGTLTSYVDRSVKAGTTYCYRVSTLIGKDESVGSSVVIAVIPPDAPKPDGSKPTPPK